MLPQNTKIALVHDDLIQQGGAERLFTTMLKMWPEADVYTSMMTEGWRQEILNSKLDPGTSRPEVTSGLRFRARVPNKDEIRKRKSETNLKQLSTSFMQKLPFKKKFYRHYFPLYPFAFESFDLSNYDLVISSSTRFSHGVITRPETCHICYMNSPGRMWWEPGVYFQDGTTAGTSPALPAGRPATTLLSPLLSWLRIWDYQAAQRVDYFIANSKTPAKRIEKYYSRDAEVVHPYVDLGRFDNCDSERGDNDFFLIVSRLAPWKRIDIAVKTCNQLQLPLKVVGSGPDYNRLKQLAGPTVEVLGRLPDKDVVKYYLNCRGFIFPQKEDFGITPLEAMAVGKPVIAYKAGGALETVIPGVTGEFFYPQTVEALTGVLENFDLSKYNSSECKKQANRFSKERFKKDLAEVVENIFTSHRQHVSILEKNN